MKCEEWQFQEDLTRKQNRAYLKLNLWQPHHPYTHSKRWFTHLKKTVANYLHQSQSCSKWASGVQPSQLWRGHTAGLVFPRQKAVDAPVLHFEPMICLVWSMLGIFKLWFVAVKERSINVHSRISLICNNKCRILVSYWNWHCFPPFYLNDFRDHCEFVALSSSLLKLVYFLSKHLVC